MLQSFKHISNIISFVNWNKSQLRANCLEDIDNR